jgi:hypothetical protein
MQSLKPDFVIHGNHVEPQGDEAANYPDGKRVFAIGKDLAQNPSSPDDLVDKPVNDLFILQHKILAGGKSISITIDSKELERFIEEETDEDNLNLKFFISPIGQDGKDVAYLASDEIIGGGGSVGDFPLKVVDSSEIVDDVLEPKIQVIYGTVNNIIPNIDSVLLNVNLDLSPVIIISQTTTIYLSVAIDSNFNITNVEIFASPTSMDDTDTVAYTSLATVIFSGGEITNIIQPTYRNNMYHVYAGFDRHYFFTQ